MRASGIRYSVGIGPMRSIDRKEDFLDGEAIYLAGRNLDYISERGIPVSFGMNSKDENLNALIVNNLMLLEGIFTRLTERQCRVIFHKMSCLTEKEIARELDITQAAVNLRARNAGWQHIKETLEVLEHIDYERYVVA